MIRIVIITDDMMEWLCRIDRNLINFHQFTDELILKDEMKIASDLFEIIISSYWKEKYRGSVIVLDKPIAQDDYNGYLSASPVHTAKYYRILSELLEAKEGMLKNEYKTPAASFLEGFFKNETKNEIKNSNEN